MDVIEVSKELQDSSSIFIAGVAAMAFPPHDDFTVLTEAQDDKKSSELPGLDSYPVSLPITARLYGH